MEQRTLIELELMPRDVTLKYPGAEGVVFRDAVLGVHNRGTEAVPVALRCTVTHQGKILLDGVPDLAPLGLGPRLAAGEGGAASFFRLLQQEVPGFGSRVNLFGYRAALNWTYELCAVPLTGAGREPAGEEGRWAVCWSPAEGDPGRVEVSIRALPGPG